jgi:hypothetical protein
MNLIKCRGRFVAVTLSILLLSISVGVAERVPEPPGVFYYQPASTVFGGEATWVNPAGLGKYKIGSFQFIGDYLDGSYFRSWYRLSQTVQPGWPGL